MREGKKGCVLVMRDGSQKEITEVSGRYYRCGDTQIRKTNDEIVSIEAPRKKTAEKEKETVSLEKCAETDKNTMEKCAEED